MKNIKKIILGLSILVIFISIYLSTLGRYYYPYKHEYIIIGTGNFTGVYYSIGKVISDMVNEKFPPLSYITEYKYWKRLYKRMYHGELFLKASHQSTEGSIDNINKILREELDFAIVQADSLHDAYIGSNDWKGTSNKNLRIVFSLHNEAVTLIARTNSISKVSDLKNKTISIGLIGSGQRRNAIEILKANGLNDNDYKELVGIKNFEVLNSLRKEEIDAAFYTIGHPSKIIGKIIGDGEKFHIIPLSNSNFMTNQHPYYIKTGIKYSDYPDYRTNITNRTNQIETFGVKAVLVTRNNVEDKVVNLLVKAVLTDHADFKKSSSVLTNLTVKDMLKPLSIGTNVIPFHKGTCDYYYSKKEEFTNFCDNNIVLKVTNKINK